MFFLSFLNYILLLNNKILKLKPDELMGKCFIRPIVQRSLTNPPKLKWYNIFLGRDQAGDVLASFELLNVLM
jgi:hypothetical protein